MEEISKYEILSEDLTSEIKINDLNFETTEDLEKNDEILGQERACKAIDFGIKIKLSGYNIYVCGSPGTGKNSYVREVCNKYAKEHFDISNLSDYVYVYNFKDEYSPISIPFPVGEGRIFKENMENIVKSLRKSLTKNFTTVKYSNETMKFSIDYENKIEEIVDELNEKAMKKNVFFHLGDEGLISIPLNKDKSVPTEEELEKLSDEDFIEFKNNSNKLHTELSKTLDKLRKAEEEYNTTLDNFDKKIAKKVITTIIKKYNIIYKKNKKVIDYFKDLEEDIIKNVAKFKSQTKKAKVIFSSMKLSQSFFNRYKVNLFIDNSERKSLPVIIENNPTYYNLNGYMEYKNKNGSFVTSFLDIKAGSIQKANGGFLILNIKDIFKNPYSWDLIKRTLKTKTSKIDSLSEYTNSILTMSLKPGNIESNIKVIIIGDYENYNLLYEYDEDFSKLFKIFSEFDTEMLNTKENQKKFASSIKNQIEVKKLKHLTKEAVFRMIRYSNRLVEDRNKLSSRFNKIMEVLDESNYISENEVVTSEDIIKTLEFKKYRNSQYQEKLYNLYKDGTLLLDITGEKIGQINGLVVISEGEYSFGSVSKITASSYIGKEGIINIEREVKNTGSSHDKGVMILEGYLGERYGKDKSLSFTSSITFEQNYGYIDGDSASSTELYLLFSSIGNIPIKQNIAVTGSVSQKGEIQPIGGVNEKIEGFYYICKEKGLTNNQGVMIPKLNVQNLVLNDEIIEAVKEGKFHIYAIDNINEGLEILTGLNKDQIDEKMNNVFKEYNDYFDDESEE